MTVTVNLTAPNFAAIVTGIGACIVDALDQTPAGAPCRQCLLLPTFVIPWDNCGPCDCGSQDCDCNGQVALAIQSVWGSNVSQLTPMTDAPWIKCGPRYWVAQVIASVTRCVPAIDEAGHPPSCDAELAAAIRLEQDRTAVRQAIACCLNDLYNAHPPGVAAWILGPSVTVGESGGCAGSETTFTIGASACDCPAG